MVLKPCRSAAISLQCLLSKKENRLVAEISTGSVPPRGQAVRILCILVVPLNSSCKETKHACSKCVTILLDWVCIKIQVRRFELGII